MGIRCRKDRRRCCGYPIDYPDRRRPSLSPTYDLLSTVAYLRGDEAAATFRRSKAWEVHAGRTCCNGGPGSGGAYDLTFSVNPGGEQYMVVEGGRPCADSIPGNGLGNGGMACPIGLSPRLSTRIARPLRTGNESRSIPASRYRAPRSMRGWRIWRRHLADVGLEIITVIFKAMA